MSVVLDKHQLGPPANGTLPGFPVAPYDRIALYFDEYIQEFARQQTPSILRHSARSGETDRCLYPWQGRILVGNGGSAAIANHLQCDHLKGIRTTTDITPRVVSLSSNVELLTAIANDMAFEDALLTSFSRVVGWRRSHRHLIVGPVTQFVQALTYARENDLKTIALTGFDGGGANALADVSIHVDATANYGIVEDVHQAICTRWRSTFGSRE